MKGFLAQRNIEFSFKRYFVDSLNAMAIGLFGSLILGLVLKSMGQWCGLPALLQCGIIAQRATGAAIAVAIAYVFRAPLLVIVAATAVGLIGNEYGGVVGALIATMCAVECGKLVSKTTPFDILVTPAVTLLIGFFVARFIGAPLQEGMLSIGHFIETATQWQPLLMSVIVAVVMGMLLTLPISSAAIAISLSLSGYAAGAATIGCAAQMIGFAVISWKDNRWGDVLSLGLGTSMLQISNIIRNPRIWLPSIMTSALLAPLAVLVFGMKNTPTGAGMGTSMLVGQIGTLEAMGQTDEVMLLIAVFHFMAPAILSYAFYCFLMRIKWIKAGDLRLDIKD